MSIGGWCFYREPKKDRAESIADWAYIKRMAVYVYMFSSHGELSSTKHGQTKDFLVNGGDQWRRGTEDRPS